MNLEQTKVEGHFTNKQTETKGFNKRNPKIIKTLQLVEEKTLTESWRKTLVRNKERKQRRDNTPVKSWDSRHIANGSTREEGLKMFILRAHQPEGVEGGSREKSLK